MPADELKQLKDEYEQARQKYSLPKFEEIDREFEIRLIEPPCFVLKEVRRAIMNHIQNTSTFFLPVIDLHVEELHSMVEIGALSKDEREKIFKLYKKMCYLIHKGFIAGMVSEKAEAEFINSAWKEWPKLKKESLPYMERIAAEWLKNDEKKKDDVHYVG